MNSDIVQESRRLLAAMTRDEKIDLVHGVDGMWTRGVPRLGVRKLHMADASMGLRDDAIPATAFPAFIALAATWNRERAAAYGQAVAEEFRAAGMDVLLGPGVNLYRSAHCGRNFEYLGEDPCLASQMVTAYIRAAQAEGVSTTVKHFAANNSDWHRCCSNSIVDERTLREVYLPAFEAAVKDGGTRALMTSYNLLNGEYAAENRWLVHKVLREEWGFEGVAMSDWEGIWDGEKAFKAGLDLEMPGGKRWGVRALREMLDSGRISEAELDRKVFQVLAWTLEIDQMQARRTRAPRGKCAAHAEVALQTAREGIVLLRNREGLLPLNLPPGSRLAVVGPAACPTPTSGGGAARVNAVEPVTILGAISRMAGPGVTVTRRDWADDLKQAAAVLVCVGFSAETEQEGYDRPWELHWQRDVNVIRHCVAHNPNTIVVIVSGGGVEMASWIDGTAAVLHAWYPGENGCQAIAEILFGKTNPSGRLPITIERSWADAAAFGNYIPAGASLYSEPDFTSQCRPTFDVNYAEGLFVGHRHFDRNGKTPLFPFGFGLSYTTFEYSALRVKSNGAGGVDVIFRVRNTGARAGAEVAQVYVGDVQASVPRPVKELKGFARLVLEPGQERDVTVTLDRRAFAFFDVARQEWVVEPGAFRVWVGASSQEMRLEGTWAV